MRRERGARGAFRTVWATREAGTGRETPNTYVPGPPGGPAMSSLPQHRPRASSPEPSRAHAYYSLYVVRRDFRRVMRGYDPAEVDEHLEKVATWFSGGGLERVAEQHMEAAEEALTHQREALGRERAEAKAETEGTAERVRGELETARADAVEAREAARREAEALVASAREEAAAATDGARLEAEGVVEAARADAERRQSAAEVHAAEMRAAAQAELEAASEKRAQSDRAATEAVNGGEEQARARGAAAEQDAKNLLERARAEAHAEAAAIRERAEREAASYLERRQREADRLAQSARARYLGVIPAEDAVDGANGREGGDPETPVEHEERDAIADGQDPDPPGTP